MTLNDFELNDHFALNSVLRRYVWRSEDWISNLGYTPKLVVNVVANFKPKRTAAASRGFLATARLYGWPRKLNFKQWYFGHAFCNRLSPRDYTLIWLDVEQSAGCSWDRWQHGHLLAWFDRPQHQCRTFRTKRRLNSLFYCNAWVYCADCSAACVIEKDKILTCGLRGIQNLLTHTFVGRLDCVEFEIFDTSTNLVTFYPRDAMLARVFAIATCPSVCLSVRPSVRRTPVLCLAERKQDREMYTVW